MAKPMKTLELHYPMIQFLIMCVNLFRNISVMLSFTCIETEIITSVKPGSSGFSSSNRVSVMVHRLKHKHNQVNTKILTFEPVNHIP